MVPLVHNAAICGRSGMALFVHRTKRDSTRSSVTLPCMDNTTLTFIINFKPFRVV
jgi:hypothetical protein